MMFSPDASPFPVQEHIDSDEDGVGFSLRLANANGVTFNELARLLASPGHLYIPGSASPAIAFLFGANPSDVYNAFAQAYFRGDRLGALLLGHQFLRPYHLRQHRPQVCPHCLRERQRAPATWALSLVTACPTHYARLIDRCVCGRPISWRRPSIDICQCGRHLSSLQQPTVRADRREIEVSGVAAALLTRQAFSLTPCSPLPPFTNELSLDTFLRLIWAFGILTDTDHRDAPRCTSRVLPTSEASNVVCRAVDRLAEMSTTRSCRHKIAPTALESIRDDCTSESDLSLIGELIRYLGQSRPRVLRRHFRTVGEQLQLFGVQNA